MSLSSRTAGSPPPMRGKVPEQGLIRLRDGITPAYAGKSTLQKHLKSVNLGSPPPMRGKVLTVCLAQFFFRITPAYAGKRQLRKHLVDAKRDHPRLCGEKVQGVWQCLSIKGSPPPMRGKVLHSDWAAAGYGITPAYAGKSKTKKEKHKI